MNVLIYDFKQFDGKAPVIQELWVIQCTSSLLSFLGWLCPCVVASDRALSLGQIELFDIQIENEQMTYSELNTLK